MPEVVRLLPRRRQRRDADGDGSVPISRHHRPVARLDTEAVDEDAADVQGHIGRYGGQDTEATDEGQVGDGTEGHRLRS
jgi:hypothetical protein